MKNCAFFIGFLIISFFSSAQLPKLDWANGIGSKNGEDNPLVKTDSSGNVIIVGTFSDTIDFDFGTKKFLLTSTGGGAIFILKLDSSGNFIWAGKIDGDGFASPEEMVLDKSGNIYITGHFYNSTDFDPSNKTFILKSVGKTYSDGDVFIAKYNTTGNFLWAKNFGGPSSEDGLSIAVDKFGNVYTCGKFEDSTDFNPGTGKYFLKCKGVDDAFISKLDASGNFVWAKNLGAGWRSEASRIALDTSDNLYISGIYHDSIDCDFGTKKFMIVSKGSSDVFVLKMDAQANFIWAKSIGGTSADYLTGMALNASGNIFLTGLYQDYIDVDPGPKNYYLAHKGNQDIFLVQLNNKGEFAGALSIGNKDYERATDIDLDKVGNIYLTGEFRGKTDFDPGIDTFFCTAAGWDLFVLKLDSSGQFVWEFTIGGSKYEHGAAITLDEAGNIYATGVIQTPVDCDPGSGKFEVKFAGGNDIFLSKFKDYCSGMNIAIDSFRHISCKDTTGYIQLHGIRGQAPYSYEWNTVPPTKDSVCSFSKRGIYSLLIKDGITCERKKTFLINGPTIGPGFDLIQNLSSSNFRPGRVSSQLINGYNDRCLPVSGKLAIVLDKLTTFNYSTIKPDKISGDTLFWNFSNMTYESKSINPIIFVTTDTMATIGDTVCFDMLIFPTTGDINPANNTKRYCYPVINSYDPNIKSINPQGECPEKYVLKDIPLTYTIQFQNTGNADAIDIYILDTLDINLDVNSLRVIGQSHKSLITEILNENVIKFRFDNIHLPDSFKNEEGSHGHVIYEVMPKKALSNGTLVKGKAGIYFDFNPPVFTNEVKNALIDTIPCMSEIDNEHEKKNEEKNHKIILYPSPNSGNFTVKIEKPEKDLTIEVYNLIGKKIKTIDIIPEQSNYLVDLNVSNGVYLVKVKNGGRIFSQKVLVVK
jgi:hypothetical protein